jgi:hypothetical protein
MHWLPDARIAVTKRKEPPDLYADAIVHPHLRDVEAVRWYRLRLSIESQRDAFC